MNMRVFLGASAGILLLIVLTRTPLIAALFAFFAMGIIPGTAFVIPAWVMLLIYPLLFIGAVFYLATQSMLVGAPPSKPKPAKQSARTKKRRTSRPVAVRKYQPATKGQKA